MDEWPTGRRQCSGAKPPLPLPPLLRPPGLWGCGATGRRRGGLDLLTRVTRGGAPAFADSFGTAGVPPAVARSYGGAGTDLRATCLDP